MDTILTTKQIEELIVNRFVDRRNEVAIPNLSWSMLPYEIDLAVIAKNGEMREYEIKRSFSDLKADFKKSIYHDAEQVYEFFYVLPLSIKDKAISLFREHQQDEAYKKVFGQGIDSLPAIIFYDDNFNVSQNKKHGYIFGRRRKLFLEEKFNITRLISIRYWNLRIGN